MESPRSYGNGTVCRCSVEQRGGVGKEGTQCLFQRLGFLTLDLRVHTHADIYKQFV